MTDLPSSPTKNPKPTPLNSLVASAQRITSKNVKDRRGFGKPEAWQDDAWDMFDLVGEQRFLATTLAGRLGQARFYIGKVSEDPVEPPEALDSDEHIAAQAFSHFGDGPMARAQMIVRLGINLFVAGDGWLVGIPRHLLPDYIGDAPDDGDPMLSLDDLEWRMLSVSEVSSSNDEITLRLGAAQDEQIICAADDIFLVRVWRPHPRRHWQADSPTRSSLAVLRELVGLTMHISAQVDSRLAGAGILVVPASAKRAIAIAAGVDPDLEDDPFTEALMDAMMTAIQDRSSAAALVPLVITVPDESTGLFQHLTFSTPLDSEARNLRDEAIRRLALGQDAPPELLLGMSTMNHWGAWLVQEDVVTTHIEPPLALICDAITTQFLWPVLVEQGMDEDEAREYVVWYDVGHMVQRPNRLQDAMSLHSVGAVGDETLREAGGFSETDAPPKMARSVELAVQMAVANPALVDNLPEIIAAFEAVLNPATAADKVAGAEDVTQTGTDVTAEQQPSEADNQQAPVENSRPSDPQTKDPASAAPAAKAASPASPVPKAAASDAMPFTLDQIVGAFSRVPGGTDFLAGLLHTYAAPGSDTSKSACLVALPAADQNLPGEEEKHATLLYLGDTEALMPDGRDQLALALQRLAEQTAPFTASVKQVGSLGDEGALVWFLDSSPLNDLNAALLADEQIGQWYADADITHHPEFTPHVTIGYENPDDPHTNVGDPADLTSVTEIRFDRLGLWWGDDREVMPLAGTELADPHYTADVILPGLLTLLHPTRND